jgi:ribosomal protein S18 acetylase RimI-like enzyme
VEGPIRVWLEPGYDRDRVGAWMLDLSGAFAWGQTRTAALARAPAAVARFVLWLRDHGESVEMPELDDTEVVEEVATKALFAVERRAVTAGELETAFSRMGHARSDLLVVARRIGRLEGPSPVSSTGSSAERERTGPDVLRHIASTEARLATRLDPGAHYDGPPESGDPLAYLAATRDWAMTRVREQFTRDPALSRTDDKGERWTLAKVLRRLVYHGFDHVDELDRRLAAADGRVERVAIRRNARVDPADLAGLLRTAGLNRGRRSPQQIARMLAATRETVSAWDGEQLVGFARAISDGVTNAYVSSVAVDPRWQDRGLGRRLIDSLIDGREGMKFVLTAREGTDEFYRRLGFVPDQRILVRQRRRSADAISATDDEDAAPKR